MATHSSTLAWRIPWAEEPGRLQSMGSLKSDTTERLHFDFSLSCIGEGNGNPLQCSCLENPRDRGAWWAAIYGVAESRTLLKWLSSSSSSLWKTVWRFLKKLKIEWPRKWKSLSPWNSPGQNTGVGRLSILQGIFPTQGSNPIKKIPG